MFFKCSLIHASFSNIFLCKRIGGGGRCFYLFVLGGFFGLVHLSVFTVIRLVRFCKRAQTHSEGKPLGFRKSSECLQMLLSWSAPLFMRIVRDLTQISELAYPRLSIPN